MCEEDGRYKCSLLLWSVMPYVVYMWETNIENRRKNQLKVFAWKRGLMYCKQNNCKFLYKTRRAYNQVCRFMDIWS